MKRLYNFIILISFLCINLYSNAADYYWVGGTGNWSEFSTHWATTSGGGTFHSSVPTAADDVYFDANSFTLPGVVTLDVDGYCHNIDWTGVANTPDFAGSFNLYVYGSLTYDPNMTASFNSGIYFNGSSTGNTVDFSTVLLNNWTVEFSGSGEWTLLSDIDLMLAMGSFTVTGGTVNTNDHDISVANFQCWPSTFPRVLNLGNSVINCQWINMWDPSTLTLNAGTSTINTESNWFDGLGLTYYDFNFEPTMPGDVMIMGSNTFNNLGFDNLNVTGVIFPSGSMQTINNITFGATCSNRKNVMSDNPGQTASIKKITGTVQEDYLNIQDIEIIGGASFITDFGVDLGNVTNWTINTAPVQTLYWVGGTGNWSDPDHWSTSSGGTYPSGGTCVPTDANDVVFDANSFSLAAEVVTIDINAFCKSMDWTGVTNTPDLINSGNSLNVFGSMTLVPTMTVSSFSGSLYFKSMNSGNTIDLAGHTLSAQIFFDGAGGWVFQNDLNTTSTIYFNKGSVNTNNFNINCSSFYSNTSFTRDLTLGTSTVTCSWGWNIYEPTNMTLNSGTSLIILNGSSFYGGNFIYNNLTCNSSVYIYDANTFNVIDNAGVGDVYFQSNATNTFNDLLNVSGDCSSLINIGSTTAGQTATISKSTGIVTVNYTIVKDLTAIGGATFNANNSIDGGNNVGWNIIALPSTDYYWIGGSGNWSDDNHWSLVSGGAPNPGNCIPTQVDNVFFDGNSGLFNQTVTVDINEAYCNNMDWTGATNARLSGTTARDINIYGSLTLNPNFTNWFYGDIFFKSDNPGNTITSAGEMYQGHVRFDGAGTWTLLDDLTTDEADNVSIYLNEGTLITNNYTVTAYQFYSNTQNIRHLNMGNSTFNVDYWSIWNGTNMTNTTGNSTINVIAGNGFRGGGLNYYDVNIATTAVVNLYGSNTYNNINAPNITGLNIEGGTTHTFSDFTFPEGTGCGDYFEVSSTMAGTPATFLSATCNLNKNWIRISDVTAGGGGTFNANNSQGVGDVTGWNIVSVPGTDYFWIGDAGDWNDPSHWSFTSGGIPNPPGCIPTSEDNVYFDANSFTLAGQAVNINVEVYCKNMDWTGVTNNPEITGWQPININGSLTFDAAMNIANYWGSFTFIATGAGNTIFSAGHIISGITFNCTGDYTLQDDLTLNWSGIQFNSGTFNTNNFDINSTNGDFWSNSSSNRNLNLGSSIITIQSWSITDNTNFTINPGTSEINTSPSTWQFNGGSLTYNDVNIHAPTWGGIIIDGSNTFNTLYIEPGTEVYFTDGTVQTTSNFQATGDPGNLISITSTTPGNTANINQTLQDFCGDWLIIQDISVGTVSFYAGENSINQGNNTGWTWSGVTAIDQYPSALCEDIPGGGTHAGVNLTSLESSIDGGNGYTHTWYEDAALTIPVATPTNVTVSNGKIFYDEVDNGICTNIAEVIYTVYSTPDLSSVITHVTCNGDSDGAIDLTASGGVLPYTFLWSSGSTTEDISGLVAGSYTVTVTDANTCSNTHNAVVNEPSALSVDSENATDVLCYGDCNGTITITASGGTPPLSFDIGSGGQGSGNFSSLCPATYQVTITDANGCSVTSSNLIVGEPPELTVTETHLDITCNGNCDGSIDLTVSGGTLAYSYLWSHGWVLEDASGLCPGTYTVTVTDANGCTNVPAGILITEPSAISIDSESATDITCNGLSDGTITITASGGTPTLSYDLGTGSQGTGNFTGIAGGTYTVTVTDGNGCTETSTTHVITDPPAISIDSESSTDLTCNGSSDGTVTVTASGGTGALSFDLGSGSQGTGNFAGLSGGTYTVTVSDANGCTETSTTHVVTEPPAISIDSESSTNITCNGDNDGTVTITASGGTGVLSFDIGVGSQGTGNFTGLAGGTYTITVTDANGCTAESSIFTIIDPTALSIDSETYTNITCNGNNDGTITVSASGGTGALSYDIGSGTQGTGNFTGLNVGLYTVTVIDANGCFTNSSTFNITQPTVLSIVSEGATDVTCNGDNDGTITIVAGGGTPPLSYDLGSGPQANGSFTALSGGTYTVTITDNNGCTVESSVLTVNEPAAISVDSETYTDVLCNGTNDGTITVNASGGSGTLSFNIGTGPQASGIFTNLGAGIFTVTVTDANGCTVESSALTISEPVAIALSEIHTDVTTCGGNDGTIDLTVGGGTPGYTYAWTGPTSFSANTEDINTLVAGSYTVVVTDANLCVDSLTLGISEVGAPTLFLDSQTDVLCYGTCTGDATVSAVGGNPPYTFVWSNGDTGTYADSLCAGPTSVTLTDAVNCIAVTSVTVTQPTQISNIMLENDVTCYGFNDGEAIAITSGGISPYSYSWNMGAVDDTVYNLVADTFTVTITDANGCTLIDTAIINQADQITVLTTGTNTTCYSYCDGTATVTPGGGIPPYTYLWNNAETTQTVANLCSSTYYVTVYDINGCYNTDSIEITQPDSMVLVITSTDDYGSGDGTATATVTGGTPPYSYFWSTTDTDSTITGLIAGEYFVTTTDANGCYVIGSDTVHLNTSVIMHEGEQNIALYPNPTNGILSFEAEGYSKEVIIRIYNMDGKLVYGNKYKAQSKLLAIIDLTGNAEGVYLIKIISGDLLSTYKIILR